MLRSPSKTPNAFMTKNRFKSSQWPIRKRLETMPGPLKRNELKRNELLPPFKRNDLQMPRRQLKRPS
jgi:hypothetical protein